MKEVKKLRFKLGFQVETEKGLVDLYSVNAENDVSGAYVQATDYDEIIRERNELAAQVERLRSALTDLEDDCKKCADTHGLDVYADLCESAANACRVMDETPAQSLEAVKREWQLRLIEHCKENSFNPSGTPLLTVVPMYDVLGFEP